MKLIATYDMTFGLGNSEEIIKAGDEFSPPGTGIANAEEHGRILIAQGAAVTPEVWEKTKLRRMAGIEWARGEVRRMKARGRK